jgi:hypothetical protein
MVAVATSATRAADQTAASVNQRIEHQTKANIAYYAQHPELIGRRLQELDQEWDIERVLEMNSAALSLIGLSLAVTRSRWWLVLPIVVQSFFLQHAIQGWCPPLPGLRRLGFRTQSEIATERYALKLLRGDFGPVPSAGEQNTQPDEAFDAVRR